MENVSLRCPGLSRVFVTFSNADPLTCATSPTPALPTALCPVPGVAHVADTGAGQASSNSNADAMTTVRRTTSHTIMEPPPM